MSQAGSAGQHRESGKFAAPPLEGPFAQPWSARKLVGLLAVFGPAAIVASVSIGAGETIVVRAGAWARYGLLWLVLLPFDILTQIAGFVLANLSIALMMAAALYLNFKLPPAYRTRLPMPAGAVLSALVLFAFAGVSGWGLAGKLFGIG